MTFAHPEFFLLLLVVPLLVAGAVLAWRRRGSQWRRLVAERLLPILVHERSHLRRWISFGLRLLALLYLIGALAAPNAGYRAASETIRGRNLIIAIDVSKSMLATDTPPTRLGAARASALELLDRLPNDRIGIIAFSETPRVVAPLTVDHDALRDVLQQLDFQGQNRDWIDRSGSDLALAVRLATKTLLETGQRNNALVILSDGETHHGGIDYAAEEADRAGLTIFAAGFGSDEGSFIPDANSRDGKHHDRDGNLVLTRLDSEPLSQLARETGGFYATGAGRSFLFKLKVAVQRLDQFELEGRKRRIAIPRFQWFLVPAMLLFVVGMLLNTSWRFADRSATVALAALLVLSPPSEAGLIPHTAAGRAFSAGDHLRALELFEEEVSRAKGERKSLLQLGEAAAAYRLGEYTHASRAYSGALLSTNEEVQEHAHYGLGNTQFYRGLRLQDKASPQPKRTQATEAIILYWRDAIAHYEGTLALNADNTNAKENRELVRKLLEDLLKQHPPQPETTRSPDDPQGETPAEDPQKNDDSQNGTNNPKPSPNENGNPNPGAAPPPSPPDNPGNTDQDPGEDPSPPSDSPIKPRPGESPEAYARRILSDNADFEMRPLPLRLRNPPRPKKDW